MSAVFDTHKFIRALTQAGMVEEQALILSDSYSELLTDRLATKDDIKSVGEEIVRLEKATKDDIESLREDFSRLEKSTKDAIESLRKDFSRLEKVYEG